MLIAVEGIDGSGKTTVAKRIVERLKNLGYNAVYLQEPTHGKYGRRIRESGRRYDAEEEMKLFLLDRMEDVEKNIIPALKSGKIVVMDRYYYSNIAYQSARGIDPEKIRKMNEKIAPKPDLVILLDLDPEIGMERIRRRGELSPFEDVGYLKKVREMFLRIADENTVIVDAGKPVEEVEEEVFRVVIDCIKKLKG